MADQGTPFIFGQWLKLRRKALDMTQDELAKRAGCSVGALRKIETGDRRPSKQLAGLLAKALEISNDDQQTFIRVARGELNLERLGQPSHEPIPAFSDLFSLLQTQPGESFDSSTGPSFLNRVPLEATPLIGRETELAALGRLFTDPQCRLLTLTGVGGIGKTRLAIEFATRFFSEFPGGVYYIPLTSVNSPDKIFPAIADVLNFGFSGPNEPKEQLLRYLSSNIKHKALLIFDNLEHLLAQNFPQAEKFGLIELIAEILRRLTNINILGTSRERLNLHGEWTYELHGLSVPPANFMGQFTDYNAIALFVNSAQRIRIGFQVTAENQLAVARICQLVEGVPLAIELAAGWVNMLSCGEIAQEIQKNIDFLTTSMRDVPERHRSIRATFDHSWRLLIDEEHHALCQLSVFQGGFDRNAAFQIAGASLTLLASLSDKSLVRRIERGRYDLHEVIRQCALSHLQDQPYFIETYERHCNYYLELVRGCERSLKSANQQEAVRLLTLEIDNIRAAWAWAIHHKKFDELGKTGRAFGWYFEIAGLYQEGIDQLEILVQALKCEPQNAKLCRVLGLALVHQALLYFRKGEFQQARKLYQDSLPILQPIGDQVLLADNLIYLGTLLHLNGEYVQARSYLEKGLALAQASNEWWFEAYATCNLGYLASLMGNYDGGYEQMMDALSIWRTIGDPHSIALGLNFMVPILNKLGKYQQAKDFMQESITLCEQSQNRWGMGTAYSYLGLACLAEGQYEEAKINLRTSLEIFSAYITGWNIARSLTYLGEANRMTGHYPEAKNNYLDALSQSIEVNAIPIAMDALLGISYLQDKAGNAEEALMLSHYIINHPSTEEETKTHAEQLRVDLETELECERSMAARRKALEISFDELVKMVVAF